MTTKRMAVITIAPEILRELLQLPEGAEVIRAEMRDGFRGQLRLVIEGAGWEVEDGQPIMPAQNATIRRTHDGTGQSLPPYSIDWGFPPAQG